MQKLLKQIQILQGRHQTQQAALDALWKQFGAAVRTTRTEKGLTLVFLAGRMGIGKSALSYLESGERRWTVELAIKAVEALSK